MGQLFQLSPQAEAYGRGASADCRALLNIFLECLGGESTQTTHDLVGPVQSAFYIAELSAKTKRHCLYCSSSFAQ